MATPVKQFTMSSDYQNHDKIRSDISTQQDTCDMQLGRVEMCKYMWIWR